MADTATNSGTTLSQLTKANARLASATSLQYQTIKKLLTDIKNYNHSSPNPRSSSSGAGATNNQHTIRLLQSAVKNSLDRWWLLLLPRLGIMLPAHKCKLQQQACRPQQIGHLRQPFRPRQNKEQGLGCIHHLTAWVQHIQKKFNNLSRLTRIPCRVGTIIPRQQLSAPGPLWPPRPDGRRRHQQRNNALPTHQRQRASCLCDLLAIPDNQKNF